MTCMSILLSTWKTQKRHPEAEQALILHTTATQHSFYRAPATLLNQQEVREHCWPTWTALARCMDADIIFVPASIKCSSKRLSFCVQISIVPTCQMLCTHKPLRKKYNALFRGICIHRQGKLHLQHTHLWHLIGVIGKFIIQSIQSTWSEHESSMHWSSQKLWIPKSRSIIPTIQTYQNSVDTSGRCTK